MSSLSDEHLVKSCNAGNKEHGRLLYERYKKYVAGILWNMTRDSVAVQDLTQETFLRVFKGLKKFKGESSFKTWLSSIAVNLCKDFLGGSEQRHTNRRTSIDDPENEGIIELPSKDSSTDPQRRLLQDELKVVVASAVDKLRPKQKTAILLWKEGFSYAEIAEITGTPEKTVGTQIYHAKIKLREFLRPYQKR